METRARSKSERDLRAFLETERERLRIEIARAGLTTDEERAGYGNHMADNASVVFEQAKSVGLRRSQEHLLADVEDALRRLGDGTYGRCRHCGQPIDSARLRALPTAALCLSCQAHLESAPTPRYKRMERRP